MKQLAFLFCVVCLLFGSYSASADRISDAITEAKQDLSVARKKLNALRDSIRDERMQLRDELTRREKVVLEKQEKVDVLRLAERDDAQSLRNTTSDAQAVREQLAVIRAALLEYRKTCPVRMSDAEAAYYESTFDELDEQFEQELVQTHTVESVFKLANQVVCNKRDGLCYKGRVVDETGRVLDGNLFFLAGYSAFANDQVAGLCLSDAQHVLPALFSKELSAAEQKEIRRLLTGESAMVPMDVSAGKGVRWEEMEQTLLQQLMSGGAVMIPIVITGCVALLLAALKAVQLLRLVRQCNALTVDSILDTADSIRHGSAVAPGTAPPIQRMLEAVAEFSDCPREEFEEILHDRVLSCLPYMEKYLGTLAVLGGVAPLLGLLGTVTGIIHVFRVVTLFGSGDATVLSGGISEALVTTESGLIIAIPVLLVHAFFSRQVRTVIGNLESIAVNVVHRMNHAADLSTD